MSDLSLPSSLGAQALGSLQAKTQPPVERPVLAVGVVLLLFGGLFLFLEVDLRMSALLLLGAGLGVTLYHGSFGFTAGWRNFILHRQGSLLRAQLILLALSGLAFLPLLYGPWPFAFPRPSGAFAPPGVSVVLGAFLFGMGMQLGGGCGSGTLYTAGSGNVRMLITLLFFIVGGVLGSLHLPWWLERPTLPTISLGAQFGVVGGLLIHLLVLGILYSCVRLVERTPQAASHSGTWETRPAGWLLRGPWPIAWSTFWLALLGVLILLVAGHPWSITFATTVWGAKALSALGVEVSSWTFWQYPRPAAALSESLLGQSTSVMNLGLLLGALIAAASAGRFAVFAPISWRSLSAAVLGGLLMGYGARLAFGCNIGALLGGIASGSLHGWLWFASAFVGTLIGVRLRPWMRL